MTAATTESEGKDPGPSLPAGIPEQIGQYRLLRLLGQGGMGSVFEAEQARPRRRVALKLMRSDVSVAGLAKRFELESAALARLQHPGIAQIYETGSVELPNAGAQPFFVMELVQGLPLTRYAAERKLDTRARLALVIRVCDAVQHAHQRGIIHRDLKPGNILVDESGQPKILDFGIARLTDADIRVTTVATVVGQILGTLAYMSPEQAAGDSGDIDTRSDVYALGVLCYELLVGRVPHDLARKLVHEAIRTIREDEPTRLSSFDKTLRGDVETIVAKALEKDRTRRYQTAGDFASDLKRYLDDQPIVARPAGAGYQLAKFAHRNRVLVGGIATTFLALVAGLVASTLLYFRADSERSRAESRRKEAETQAARASSSIDFLNDMLTASNPEEGGQRDVTLREVADRAARNVAGSFEGQPELEATLLGLLGGTYGAIDRGPESERLFERALTLLAPLGRDANATRADVLNGRGVTRLRAGRNAEALADFEAAIALLPAADPALRSKRYRALENWGNAARSFGRDEEVIRILREVLAGRIELYGEASLDAARSRHNLATLLRTLGAFDEARPLAEAALATFQRELGADHVMTIHAMGSMAAQESAAGRFEQAAKIIESQLAATRVVFGEESSAFAAALEALASIQSKLARFADAERNQREALRIFEKVGGEQSIAAAGAARELARVLNETGRSVEAEPLLRRSAATLLELAGRDSDAYAFTVTMLALVLKETGKMAEAETRFRESLEIEQRRHGPTHPETLIALENLGNYMLSRGDVRSAETMVTEVLAGRRKTLGEDHPAVARTLYNLACVKRDGGDAAAAKELFAQALERFRRQFPPTHPNVLVALRELVTVDLKLGELDEAEQLQRDLLDQTTAANGERHAATVREMQRLAAILVTRGVTEEASELLRRAWDVAVVQSPRDGVLIREIKQELVRLYTDADDLESASEWRARVAPPVPDQ